VTLLEVCVESVEALERAQVGGAGRIELCSRLDFGGLSPGRDLLDEALRRARVPLHVMVRPRPGSFLWSAAEVASMEAEIAELKRMGAAGVVFGALTYGGAIDSPTVQRLLAAARPLSATFHRAFDETADLEVALDELIALGVDRVLTSGGAIDAFEGRHRLRELVRRARGRIVVMAGGGVRPENAAAILEEAGVTEVHGSVPFRLPAR
jgi:copper homeostasis protein